MPVDLVWLENFKQLLVKDTKFSILKNNVFAFWKDQNFNLSVQHIKTKCIYYYHFD